MDTFTIEGVEVDLDKQDFYPEFLIEVGNFLHDKQNDFVLEENQTILGHCDACGENSFSVLSIDLDNHLENLDDYFTDFDDFGDVFRILVCEECGWWYIDGENYSIM